MKTSHSENRTATINPTPKAVFGDSGLILTMIALALLSYGCTDQSIPTSQNSIVITSCGVHPDESCILITAKAHDNIRETNFNHVSVEIGNLQLAARVFHFTTNNTFLLYCYPMQQNVPLPDENQLRAARVCVEGKWYNGNGWTILVPHDGYSGRTVFTTAALTPRFKGNGNQLWVYQHLPPNYQLGAELRSSDKRVLKVMNICGESGDPLETGQDENAFYSFSPGGAPLKGVAH